MSKGSGEYEIRVCGQLDDRLLAAFPTLNCQATAGQTLLRGPLVDSSAMYGLLALLESFGLELIEVHRLDQPVCVTQIPS